MNITQQKNDDLTAIINLELTKDDYEKDVNKAINRQAKNADIKGFRKGKVPKNLVKKMYGNAILANVLNQTIDQSIRKYIQENNLELLGQPIPVEEENVEFDVNNLKDINFQYKIGLKPKVDVSYIETSPEFTQYDIEIDDEMIDKEVEHIQSQFGDVENPAGEPEGKDALEVTLKELDEEGNVKDDGYEHTTSFGFDQLKLKKDQKAIGKLGVGDTYSPFNVYRAFDKEKEAIAKQILELDEEMMNETGTAFELKLNQINRVSKAEINQEFFDKVYGKEKVSSEEEMREKIRENLNNYLSQATDNQLKNDVYTQLLEEIEVELPDAFLKEWLEVSRENDEEQKVTKEDIEKEYEPFAKNLKSSLVFAAISEKAELKVDFDELKAKVRDNLIQQFKHYGMPLENNEEMLEGMIQQFMQDEKQVRQTHDQLMDEKIFNYLKENVKLNNKSVTLDEFNALNEDK